MKINYKSHCLCLLTFVCLFGAPFHSVTQGAFILTDGYVSAIEGTSNVNFTLTFNQAPDFFTVDQAGRAANDFQFYIFTTTNMPYRRPYASLIRGGEIHVAGVLPIRNDSPEDTGDPNAGGWGSIRGSVSYSLTGTTMTFSIPASVLNVVGSFAYELGLGSYGGGTTNYFALSGGQIVSKPPRGRYEIALLARDYVWGGQDDYHFYVNAINNNGQTGGFSIGSIKSGFGWMFYYNAEVSGASVCETEQPIEVWHLNASGILAGRWNGTAAVFGTPYPGGVSVLDSAHFGVAVHIDNAGCIVGTRIAQPASNPEYGEAFLWREGLLTGLGSLNAGESSAAISMNNRMEIVGFSEPGKWYDAPYWSPASWTTYRTNARAFVWKAGVLTDLNQQVKIPSGWVLRVATDINDRGQIIGVGAHEGRMAGFLFDHGMVTDLGLPGTNISVNAMNQWGQMVGSANGHPFLWEQGVLRDLNEFLPPGSDWVLNTAVDINDLGQIVGEGSCDSDSGGRARKTA